MKKVGIIGCGTIGSELARAIDGKEIEASLVVVYDRFRQAANKLANTLHTKVTVAHTIDEFLSEDLDIVVEAGSQEAVRDYAKLIIERNFDIMIMSVGALLDSKFYGEIIDYSKKKGVKIYFPTGAIAGIDAIRSVRHLLSQVMLTTTKNPKSLEGAPFFTTHNINLEKIRKPTVLYEGSAIEVVKLFPANVNVAAVLSLAGIGGSKTKVRIVADPKSEANIHEIHAKGTFGEMSFKVKNVPTLSNPKTSYLAVLSAIECLRGICDDKVTIGT